MDKLPEGQLEEYRFPPRSQRGRRRGRRRGTPVADRDGAYRHPTRSRRQGAERRARCSARGGREGRVQHVGQDPAPGAVLISGHPHPDLAHRRLLVTQAQLGEVSGDWHAFGSAAVFADHPHRPLICARPEDGGPTRIRFAPLTRDDKPRASTAWRAVVVGPEGDEIFTDEHGRVRARGIARARSGREETSCWLRVSQPGRGRGVLTSVRVGQEVLVGFLGGDPDHLLVVGARLQRDGAASLRVPEHKTRTSLRSNSSPGGAGANDHVGPAPDDHLVARVDDHLALLPRARDRRRPRGAGCPPSTRDSFCLTILCRSLRLHVVVRPRPCRRT